MVVYEPVLGVLGVSPPFCAIALDGVPGTEEESDPIVHWSRGTETYTQIQSGHAAIQL